MLSRVARSGWRHLAPPLAVWLLLCTLGTWGVLWVERRGEREMQQRFDIRVQIAANFVSNYVKDLIEREFMQGEQFLSDETVDAETFERSVGAFGYPNAVLVDAEGRLLQVYPHDSAMLGAPIADRYEHLASAVERGVPSVSAVVPAASTGQPVVAFAVPFNTPYGRRVFSGAVDVASSPIGGYLAHAMPIVEAQVHLIDGDGTLVGSNEYLPARRSAIADRDYPLAAALGRGERGHFGPVDSRRYFASEKVPGAPWRLVASVPEDGLYGPILTANATIQAIALGLAGIGLLAVLMAARAARGRAALRASEAEFRGLFDSSLIGMVVTQPDGTIERTNAAFAALVGHPPGRPQPEGWGLWLPPEDRHRLSPLSQEALLGRTPGFTVTARVVTATGRLVPVEITSSLVRDEAGVPRHFSTQVLDISERVARQEEQRAYREELAARARELESANVELQAANQRVADMVAMLTHDVRQPIATITGYCELLTEMWDETDERGKRRDVDRIAATAASMSGYVEEILTLTQVDADTLFARPAPLKVHDVVAEALAALPGEQRAAVTVDLEEPLVIYADPRQVQQMLINLIGNALKYGEPPLSVSARSVDGGVEIEVVDSGEGVPEDFVPHLFDRFARASSGVAPTKKGTGLGLYIVQQLAHANSGSVTYRPHQPSGACFILALPTVDAALAVS